MVKVNGQGHFENPLPHMSFFAEYDLICPFVTKSEIVFERLNNIKILHVKIFS